MIRKNMLVVIENGVLTSYCLDDRKSWSIGRKTRENTPDICLHSRTVSRKQGCLMERGGFWFYVDGRGTNGTFYIHMKGRENQLVSEKLGGASNHRIRPVSLNSGDRFIFGAGDKAVVNAKTAWAVFLTEEYEGGWKVSDTFGKDRISFTYDNNKLELYRPEKGTMVHGYDGTAIYMGDVSYVTGAVSIEAE